MNDLHRLTPVELAARLRAEREGDAFLALSDGDGVQRLIPLRDRRALTIGRRDGNDVVLGWDREVSRTHLELQRVGTRWTAADDGLSRNGVYVNGRRVTSRLRLTDGDTVRCGRTLIVFRDPQAREDETIDQGSILTPPTLSGPQRRVLVALCRPFGRTGAAQTPASNREIAAELWISLDGVKSHMRTLFEKLDIDDLPQNQKRAELARRAIARGIVSLGELRESA